MIRDNVGREKSKMDCGALDCYKNSRNVDKNGFGECKIVPSINIKGNCQDYDVYSLENYKFLTNGKTPPELKKRLVKDRDSSFKEWTDFANRWFEKAQKKYNP